MLSVSSRARQEASRPETRRAVATVSASARLATWAADRLTLIVSGAASGRARHHSAAWRQACSSTQRPIGSISPFSSATGMKSTGEIRPRSGCSQRTSASTETIARSRSDTSGW